VLGVTTEEVVEAKEVAVVVDAPLSGGGPSQMQMRFWWLVGAGAVGRLSPQGYTLTEAAEEEL